MRNQVDVTKMGENIDEYIEILGVIMCSYIHWAADVCDESLTWGY